MNQKDNKPNKFGDIWLLLSGVLFFAIGILDFFAGPPPSTGPEILNWIENSKIYISFSNELLFFAIVFMLPGIRSLNELLVMANANKYSFGCAIMKVVISLFATLLVIEGRLVFSIFNINLTASSAELLVSLWYGGLHAVYILMAGATILVSMNLRKLKFGNVFVGFGIVTGILELLGSYPWLIGQKFMLICQSFFAFWFIAVGMKLYKISLNRGTPLNSFQ